MSRVLVVGGAGYIGSHTCKALALQGHDAVVVDNLSEGHREFVKWGPLHELDVRDTHALIDVFKKEAPQAVIHFAASAYVGESVENPQKYYDNNFVGVLSLLEAMQAAQCHNLVFSSTCAVYGEPTSLPIAVDAPTDPINPYGRSKLMAEQAIKDFAKASSIRAVVLRYFNAAGCDFDAQIGERHNPETHLIPNAINAALGIGPELQLFGDDYPTDDGTCVRDYIHVNDLAAAHIKALAWLDAKDRASEQCVSTFNLGTESGFSIRQVIDAVERAVGKRVPHTICARRPGDPPELVADSQQTQTSLGWVAQHSDIDSIVSSAVAWARADNS